MIAQFVIEINVRTAWGVEAGEQFAHYDQQLHARGFFDEAAFHLGLIRLCCLVLRQNLVGINVELETLIAVRRLARDGVVIWLVRCDDAAVLAEECGLEVPEIVARVVDAGRDQKRRSSVAI